MSLTAPAAAGTWPPTGVQGLQHQHPGWTVPTPLAARLQQWENHGNCGKFYVRHENSKNRLTVVDLEHWTGRQQLLEHVIFLVRCPVLVSWAPPPAQAAWQCCPLRLLLLLHNLQSSDQTHG